jgi:hypothetical protein
MSVRWMRTAQISNGKFMEAVSWAKEMSGYVEKKIGMGKVDVWVDSFGVMGTIRWTMDFPDLAALDKAQTIVLGDADYWKQVNKAATSQLFIDGATEDHVLRSM